MKNTAPNSEATAKKIAALPAAKARERKKRIGSIGSARAQLPGDERDGERERRAASAPTTSALPQPAALPRTRPHTTPSAAARDQREPGQVERAVRRRGSRASARSTSGISASPIGTLSQKIHSQAMPSVIAPPTTGPLATASPVTAK